MMFVKTCEIKTYCKNLLEDSFLRAVGSTSCHKLPVAIKSEKNKPPFIHVVHNHNYIRF